MDNAMTASVEAAMTDGQIETLASSLRDAARKHREEIPRDAGQEALGTPNLGMMMFAAYRKLVEEISKRIVRLVTVDRTRSLLNALKACGRKLYVNESVVATAPLRNGAEAKMTYFTPRPECYENGVLSCQKLDDEYKMHRLVPDLQAQTDDNAKNPEFADSKPNACQWKDKDGNWCYATFDVWRDERGVCVGRGDYAWSDDWSFGGVPDESSASAV